MMSQGELAIKSEVAILTAEEDEKADRRSAAFYKRPTPDHEHSNTGPKNCAMCNGCRNISKQLSKALGL
jgi:hypothetical protein